MKPRGHRWRDLRLDMELPLDNTAARLGISCGHLRNIEASQPRATVSDRLVRRATRLFNVPSEDLVDSGDGVPDEPPSKEQEPETNTGPGREGGNTGRGDKDKKGPKRLKDAAA